MKTSQGGNGGHRLLSANLTAGVFPVGYRRTGKHITDRTRNSPGVSTSSPPGCHQPRVSDTLIGLLLFLQLSQGVSQIALKPQTKANGRGAERGRVGHGSPSPGPPAAAAPVLSRAKEARAGPQQEVSAPRLACTSLWTWGPARRQWVLKPGRREGQGGQGGGTELGRWWWWGFPTSCSLIQ